MPLALNFSKLSNIPLEQRFPSLVPRQLPPDTGSPEYQRQQEINRFHGLRDMEIQLGLYR